MAAINPNKQKLDELLGIVSEMQKSDPNEFNNILNGMSTEERIPDDIPEVVEMENQTLTQEAVQAAKPTPIIPVQQPQVSQPVAQPVAQPPVATSSPSALEALDEHETAQTQKSLSEIDSLISVAKQVINHVYSVVTSTDILDASTISAAANLIKETKNLVQQHLEIQKSQRDFLNQIQMEEIKHQHQIELMEKKFELEKLRLEAKNPPLVNGNVPTQQSSGLSGGLKSYSSADMMRMLDEND